MFYILLFLCFTVGILTRSQISVHYASMGLKLWFENMIPALLPFMILSGVMVRKNMAGKFASILHPLLGKPLNASRSDCYVIFVGFLCGFPMGAKTAAELYARGELTQKEAVWLLSFCNNIGPVYFCSFVLPTLQIQRPLPCLFAMYGLPFLYGVLLRHTIYREKKTDVEERAHITPKSVSLPEALEESIFSAVQSILMLGGYMILFCLMNLLPHILKGGPIPLLGPFLEITSGIIAMNGTMPVYCLVLLAFGGLSCLAQTYSSLKGTDLTEHIGEYFLHKLVLTALTALYYLTWFLLFPASFPS